MITDWPRLSRTVLAGGLALGLPLAFSAAGAQFTGLVSGRVIDSLGAPIYGAEVSISTLGYRFVTDDAGSFHLSGVPAGTAILSVRRLGFLPRTISVALDSLHTPSDGMVVRLARAPSVLDPVLVKAKRVEYTGRLAGYYERLEHHNSGYFITRDQIDHENPRMLSQLLQHVPGVSAVRGRFGVFNVRLRGRNCAPLVWIDGTPMPAAEVDLDSFSPQTLHGIEVYLGSTTAPARFILNRDVNSCGTIVLWSRGPDTDPILSNHRPAVNLDNLLTSLTVYTADQVDTRAQLPPDGVAVAYPPSLFAEGVGGSVIAEFIVAADGRVEDESFGIVSSTNALFSEAVKQAIENVTFFPARRGGVAVRQLVQQPFSFIGRGVRSGG